MVFLLSLIYMTAGHFPLVSAAFFGMKAAVFALVAEAMIRIGKRALKGQHAFLIAAASFAALFFWSAPFPLVILAAGLIETAFNRFGEGPAPAETADPSQSPPPARTLVTAALGGQPGLHLPSAPRLLSVRIILWCVWDGCFRRSRSLRLAAPMRRLPTSNSKPSKWKAGSQPARCLMDSVWQRRRLARWFS